MSEVKATSCYWCEKLIPEGNASEDEHGNPLCEECSSEWYSDHEIECELCGVCEFRGVNPSNLGRLLVVWKETDKLSYCPRGDRIARPGIYRIRKERYYYSYSTLMRGTIAYIASLNSAGLNEKPKYAEHFSVPCNECSEMIRNRLLKEKPRE